MKYKLFIFAFSFIFFSQVDILRAQNQPEDQVNRFFATYQNSPNEALDELFASNKWMMENQGNLNEVKVKLNNILPLIGKFQGFEKISEINKGESLIQLIYFGKYERQPLRYIFLFYKPSDKWMIFNFLFDDNILED